MHLLCSSAQWQKKETEEQLKSMLHFLIDQKYGDLKAKNIHQQQPLHLACSLRTPVAAQIILDTQKVDLCLHLFCLPSIIYLEFVCLLMT